MSLIAAIRRTGSTYVKAAKCIHMPAVPMETTLRNYATYFQPWPRRQARFLMQGTTRGIATASEGYLAAPCAKKVGVAHLAKRMQDQDPVVMLTAYDFPSGRLAAEAGVDLVLVGDSVGNCRLGLGSTVGVTMDDMESCVKAVRRGVDRAGGRPLVIGDLPFGSYLTTPDALANAARLIAAGADAVKLEGGTGVQDTIQTLVSKGLAVVGHVGLLPQTAQTGGLRTQGTQAASALRVVKDAAAVEAAGAFAVVLECVPAEVGAAVQRAAGVPVIGIGAGASTAGQVLVCDDVLGLHGSVPAFAKTYADARGLTLAAYEAYVQEVRAKSFPAAAHARRMDPGEARALYEHLGMDLPAEQRPSAVESALPQESRSRAPSQILTLMRGRRKSMRAMSTAPGRERPVLGTKAELRAWRRGIKGTVALVPTMGNLHAAHLALVELAARQADHVVVSIFVNPLQFAAHEDLDTYPRSLSQDLAALPPGVTVFAPAPAEMYPSEAGAGTVVVPKQVEGLSEAACRPHFFSGVATVCLKLFNLVQPDAVVFGEKDAMQCSVIRRMLRDLDLDIRLVVGPTGRTAEGVAMSSRNSYLTPAMWQKAPAINQALESAAASLGSRCPPAEVRAAVSAELERAGMTVQYISIADGDMAELEALPAGPAHVCISVACLLREGEKQVRLLDCKNVELG